MARGKRTDPAAAVLAKVMHQMGFNLELITTASGLPRATVKDIVEGNGPWRQMPQTELFEITRLRLLRAIDWWFFDEGKRKERTFAKKKEATAFYESTRSKVRDNEYTPPSKHSVKEMAERYLEAMKPKVKVQTYLQYKCHVDKYIVPKFGVGYNPMTRVDRQRDNKTLEAIEAEAIRGLTQVDDDGAGDGHLRAVGPREVYSGEEVKKLIDASKPGLERAFHMTAVMTGMRHGELDGLQWDRVDFDKSRIFISRSLTELKGGAIIERPKSRAAYRYLPMTADAGIGTEAMEAAEPDKRDGLGFYGSARPRAESEVEQPALEAGREAAKIKALTMHNLRHTYASQHLLAGTAPTELSQLMGHADSGITSKVYSHWTHKDYTGSATALEARYFASGTSDE
jgi:integrase